MATSTAPASPASGESPGRRRSQSPIGGARDGLAALYPVDGRRGPSALTVGAGILFVAAMAFLSVARQSGPGALNSIWAEDGHVFYQATFRQGFVTQLFTPYNGYLVLVPRLLIQVVSWFPVGGVAEAIAVIGAVSSSALALLVYHAAAPHIPSRVLRLCIAVPTALIVFGQVEVGNSIVNLQWYLLYAAFWMFLWNPQSLARRILAGVVLLCAVGSDPVSTLLLSPLLLARLWARPWRDSAWQTGGVAAGLAYQAVSVLRGGLSTRVRPPGPFYPDMVPRWFGDDVLGHALVSPAEIGVAAATSVGAVLLLLFALAAWHAGLQRQQWLLAGVCAGYSVVIYFALTIVGVSHSDRYGVVPVLLMITAAAVLCCCRAKWPTVLLCVLIAANVAANYYGGSPSRGAVPGWSTEVRLGRDACRHPGTTSAVLHTAPGGTWEVVVPCSALLGR